MTTYTQQSRFTHDKMQLDISPISVTDYSYENRTERQELLHEIADFIGMDENIYTEEISLASECELEEELSDDNLMSWEPDLSVYDEIRLNKMNQNKQTYCKDSCMADESDISDMYSISNDLSQEVSPSILGKPVAVAPYSDSNMCPQGINVQSDVSVHDNIGNYSYTADESDVSDVHSTSGDLSQEARENVLDKSVAVSACCVSEVCPRDISTEARKKRIREMTKRKVGFYQRRHHKLQAQVNDHFSNAMRLLLFSTQSDIDVDTVSTTLGTALNVPFAVSSICKAEVVEVALQAKQGASLVQTPDDAHKKKKKSSMTSPELKKNTKANIKPDVVALSPISSCSRAGKKKNSKYEAHLPVGNDPESKRDRRRIRNRLSAQYHRQKKQDTIQSMQNQINDRNVEIASLHKQIQMVSSHPKHVTFVCESLTVLIDELII